MAGVLHTIYILLLSAQHFVPIDPPFQEKLLVQMKSYTTSNPSGPTRCLIVSLSTGVCSCFFCRCLDILFRMLTISCPVSADNGSGVYLLPSEELAGPASPDSAHRGLERELRHASGHQREVPLHGEARSQITIFHHHGQLVTKLLCSIKSMIMIITSN